jgi:hypothetical protein
MWFSEPITANVELYSCSIHLNGEEGFSVCSREVRIRHTCVSIYRYDLSVNPP